MSNYTGINVSATVVPYTDQDHYPIVLSEHIKGSWHEVATIAERDAIFTERRSAGMAVYVTGTQTLYILENDLTTWTPFNAGGASLIDSISVNGVVQPIIAKNVDITVPTEISDLNDDTATNPIEKANTLTGLTATINELNYTDGVTSNIQTQLNAKQNTLTAGTNVNITNDVISATDTTYTAGTGLNLSNNSFSVDTNTIQQKITSTNKLNSDLVTDSNQTNKFVTDAEKNTWNAKQNALTAGNNIQINNNTISATDTTYTAGTNVQINGTTISATDTTYTAGNGLNLTNSEFAIDGTVVATKTDLAGKQNTLTAGNNITISGDTISAIDTTYAAGNGLILTGTTFSANVIDNVTTTSTTNALSANMGKELNDRLNNVESRGRYLSQWNAATGLPVTDPTTSPYTYHTGDYFIVSNVAASGGTNYRPNGSSYTRGVASTTVETATVAIDDTYIYDGTSWLLQTSGSRTISFANIAGQPTDNTNLASALNNKVTTNATISGDTKCKITYDSKGLVTGGANLAESDIPSLHLSKISDVTATAAEINYTSGVTSNIQTQLNSKQSTLTAGNNIQITGSTISATDTTYTAGTGISISADNVISNTQTSAEWGNITGTLSNQTDLQTALNAKQNALTAGSNIQINGNTISATDTTYTAGTGIDITGGVISSTQVIPTKISDLTDDTASYPIDKADTLTGLTATVAELNYSSGVTSNIQTQLNAKQNTLTAGNNIQITNNTISATDTTYTAGNGISITNTTINADVISVNSQTGAVTLGIDDVAPSQTGQSGKVLTTDGTNASWNTINAATLVEW